MDKHVLACLSVMLAGMIQHQIYEHSDIFNNTANKATHFFQQVKSTYEELSTGFSDWWTSTDDDMDGPLLIDGDDFDVVDDFIGMEIVFVPIPCDGHDDDMSLSDDDDDYKLD